MGTFLLIFFFFFLVVVRWECWSQEKKLSREWVAGSRAVDDVVDLVLHQHVTFFFLLSLSLGNKQML